MACMSFNVLVKYGRGPRPCGCVDLKERKLACLLYFWNIVFYIPCLAALQSRARPRRGPPGERGRCAGDAGLRRRRRPRRATRRLRPPHDRDRERQRRDPRARAIRTTTSWNSFRTPGRACARGDGSATPRAQKPRRSDANATRRSGSATRPGSSWPRETTCSRRSSRSSSINVHT